jgi:hypothetical protein
MEPYTHGRQQLARGNAAWAVVPHTRMYLTPALTHSVVLLGAYEMFGFSLMRTHMHARTHVRAHTRAHAHTDVRERTRTRHAHTHTHTHARTLDRTTAHFVARVTGVIARRSGAYVAIQGERTRVERQMLGGGFRALYRLLSASLYSSTYTCTYQLYCTFGHDPIFLKCPNVRWTHTHTYIHTYIHTSRRRYEYGHTKEGT